MGVLGCKEASVRAGERILVSSIPVGPWNVTCMDSIRRKTHGALPRCTANSEHTIGAMDEMSQKVQKASTQIVPRSRTRLS